MASGPAVILAALALGACSADTSGPAQYSRLPDDGEFLFLVSPIVPNAQMEALFQGPVEADSAGCIRIHPPDAATVVWPRGFSLDRRSSGAWVVDQKGRDVGVLGESFRFSGGEVPFLHQGVGFSPAEALRIQDRCPGRFWIVGEVSLPPFGS
jgi:hypothetical protein